MKRRQAGLTLIELMVVLSILVLMAGLLIPLLESFVHLDGRHRAKIQLGQIRGAFEAYFRDDLMRYGKLENKEMAFSAYDGSIGSLVPYGMVSTSGFGSPTGACYIESWFSSDVEERSGEQVADLKDPWGNGIEMGASLDGSGFWNGASSELVPLRMALSVGPDETRGTVDDVREIVLMKPVLFAEGMNRVASINSALARFNELLRWDGAKFSWTVINSLGVPEGVTDPSAWVEYHSLTSSALADLMNTDLINDSPIWGNTGFPELTFENRWLPSGDEFLMVTFGWPLLSLESGGPGGVAEGAGPR